jgi:Fe-S cluster assembly iron-binding protein IscA
MALDESQENDLTFIDQGITFVIDKEIFEEVKPIRIDFIESAGGSGFQLISNLQSGNSCGGCC